MGSSQESEDSLLKEIILFSRANGKRMNNVDMEGLLTEMVYKQLDICMKVYSSYLTLRFHLMEKFLLLITQTKIDKIINKMIINKIDFK